MLTKKTFITSTVVLALFFAISAQSAWWPFSKNKESKSSLADATELTWENLIPDDFVPPENPFTTMTQEEIDKLLDGSEESNREMARLQEAFNYAPVVNELNGTRVKIAGYITPLEFDGQLQGKEFLLVPYVGACMHTPPPPSNQIVHAVSPKMVNFPGMYEAVWAYGTLLTEPVQSVLAESGYKLEIDEVLPYSQQ